MVKPKISVIIPTLNEAPRLKKLLPQLLAIPQLEIIVSDGGSSDATEAVAQEFGVIFVSGPAGRGKQLNRGAKIARGDILFFLHADSQVDPSCFSQLQQVIATGRQWGCFTLAFDDPGLFFNWVAWASSMRVRLFSSCYGDQGIFCHREFFQSLGGFPDYPFLEDLSFSRQARKIQKASLLKATIITSSRRFKQNGLLKTLWKMQTVKFLYWLGCKPEQLLPYYQTGLWRNVLWKKQ